MNARPGAVLLVEDDPALRLLCRINLELEHFQVAEAATLDEAREAVATARPAVVFLDMHLGPVPSDDLLDELLGARIPVVLVSGTTDLDRYAGRADGVLDEALRARRSDCRRATPCGRLRSREHDGDHRTQPAEFESSLADYLYERSEESRAVRVGEKETSEQAQIVARYADLFSREQLDALREAEDASGPDERERLYRLRKTCEGGLVAAIARRAPGRAREPPARGAHHVPRRGAAAPLRTGAARRPRGLR